MLNTHIALSMLRKMYRHYKSSEGGSEVLELFQLRHRGEITHHRYRRVSFGARTKLSNSWLFVWSNDLSCLHIEQR